jgi:dUTP pyrophosphatase
MKLNVKKLHPKAILPTYGSAGAAGADLYALPEGDPIVIEAGHTVMIHTGLAMAIPEGYAGLVYARSGLASKRGLAPANKVGVIDSDYRGELMVALHNHGTQPQTVEPGERVAQFVLTPVITACFAETDDLDSTERGEGGFGSTGRN